MVVWSHSTDGMNLQDIFVYSCVARNIRISQFMRIAILSDIHGNQLALQAVLHDLAQQPSIDQLVIAGDLCLKGP